jgi:hypothetical protein
MRVLVVYESMYGNTHAIAEHISDGLRTQHEVLTASVRDSLETVFDEFDLLVVGGPTHVHGVSTWATRKAAREAAEADDGLDLDPESGGLGLRDWFKTVAGHRNLAAAFDTRIDASAAMTGRASKGIARRLRHHGYRLLVEPESFLVDKQNHLLDGEAERAERWGEMAARALTAAMSTH